MLLDARWQDAPVAWCTYIYVDNDHALATVPAESGEAGLRLPGAVAGLVRRPS